jgi:hypothetical protein
MNPIQKKSPKWKVGIANTDYYMVEVEADSEEAALEKALTNLDRDPDYWHVGQNQNFTGVFINDYNAKNYHAFVNDNPPYYDECGEFA